MKLFIVVCRGMQSSVTGPANGTAYVAAKDAGQAYKKLREYLDKEDLGFESDRELLSVTLVAEEGEYPDCRTRLFL